MDLKRIVDFFFYFMEPLKNDVVDEDYKTTDRKHDKSVYGALRVVTCSVGYGCVWERRFLVVGDCHVVTVEAGEEHEYAEEPKEVRDVNATERMLSF